MAGAILIVLALLVLALLAIAILYVLGIRSKSAAVRTAARRFHHGVGNPLQLRSAGTPGTYASVIRHKGRRTGRTYQTPVWAVPTEDGFVIAIVYGDAVGLSITLTFLSLVFWSYVIGPLGALLAVPLSLFVKALLVDADPGSRWLDRLMSPGGQGDQDGGGGESRGDRP